MTSGVVLTGLDGTNPLAFFAALGVVSLPASNEQETTWLSWTDDVIPHPVVDGYESVEALADAVMVEREAWRNAVALTFSAGKTPIDDVKLAPGVLRAYIDACRSADDDGRSAGLAGALVAEGARDNNGAAKPTDLHFTAGQQKFVRMARDLIAGLERGDVEEALAGPWTYTSELPSFMWDITDDRVYAVSAFNPSSEKKRTVPGAEFLALIGLRALPAFAEGTRATTTGCAGSWKQGVFVWPLWTTPVSFRTARTLVAHAPADERWLPQWGVRQVLHCQIRRSDQGGYGSFSPPRTVWSG